MQENSTPMRVRTPRMRHRGASQAAALPDDRAAGRSSADALSAGLFGQSLLPFSARVGSVPESSSCFVRLSADAIGCCSAMKSLAECGRQSPSKLFSGCCPCMGPLGGRSVDRSAVLPVGRLSAHSSKLASGTRPCAELSAESPFCGSCILHPVPLSTRSKAAASQGANRSKSSSTAESCQM